MHNWRRTACIVAVLCGATATSSSAQTFGALFFNGTDGGYPLAALVQAGDGNLYGTTSIGGSNCDGTVFKISPGGVLTTVHSFDGQDGFSPAAAVIQAADGNLYGTVEQGGARSGGTVFKITLSGEFSMLYTFCSQASCSDGSDPYASLVEASDGNFYGTTAFGGTPGLCPGAGCGTIFEITADGTLTTLHDFDFSDGANPVAGLVQGMDGNFYGTTGAGGTSNLCLNGHGCGTFFKVTPKGVLTTLYSFCSVVGCAVVRGPPGTWFRPPTETSTESPSAGGSTTPVRPSGSRQAAR